MDIRPPKRRQPVPRTVLVPPVARLRAVVPPVEKAETQPAPVVLPGDEPIPGMSLQSGDKPKNRRLFYWLIAFVGASLLVVGGLFGWYFWAISPKSGDEAKQSFVIQSGENLQVVAQHLEQKQLIHSAFAFELYAKLHRFGDVLQAGSYKLAPKQSVAEIVADFVKGQDNVYNVFIPPGLTLKQLADPTVKGSFAEQGFSAGEIQQAFVAPYASLLLKDRPAGASLEGYIFPETFQVRIGASLQSILERSFDELYGKLQKDGLLAKFTARGLTLYQALTLASIVQEETSSPASQPQVAQVFLSRMQIGMTLGSDVTFIYAARQLGITPSPDLDSPYNTRIHTGLPPGPIANMNYSAIQAVADPAPGDYLFFVAGDDGVIYYSRDNTEHDQQVQQHCQKGCSEPLQ